MLRLVTLAPERAGALAAIGELVAHGVVVSIGHTDATAEQTRAAADAGARMVTHLFNAQRGVHHREPGVSGHALVDDRLTLGLIADLHHVHPDVVRLVMRTAGERVALVTDAAAPTDAPPGTYLLGGEVVVVDDGGSAPSSRRDARRLDAPPGPGGPQRRRARGRPREPSCAASPRSRRPCSAAPTSAPWPSGAVADLVWWSDDLTVTATWPAGTPLAPTLRDRCTV